MFARNEKAEKYKSCDTIFYQGASCSQTQVMHYTGNQVITATTGEQMRCTGIDYLEPINVIFNLHIGPEIADVNLNPFANYSDYFSLSTLLNVRSSWNKNYYGGVEIQAPISPSPESVRFHSLIAPQISYGQESDITSHHKKYLSWKKTKTNDDLILYSVSRGTAATFCAYATYQYPEVKLVILEGAIDSMENVMKNLARHFLRYETLANLAVEGLRSYKAYQYRNGLFGYREGGPSPLSLVDKFPENVPVVFITSEKDIAVSPANTKNIATMLNNRGKNDVYLLQLKNSRHSYYMYDDWKDRREYEDFIHAIYKKYGLAHDAELAFYGEHLVEEAYLTKNNMDAPKLS